MGIDFLNIRNERKNNSQGEQMKHGMLAVLAISTFFFIGLPLRADISKNKRSLFNREQDGCSLSRKRLNESFIKKKNVHIKKEKTKKNQKKGLLEQSVESGCSVS